jgi:uncharacterized membrane protein
MPELVQPNLHVVAIHFPIALLMVGTLIECLSFLGWRKSSARVAARWMILLGAILSVPAVFTGLYAWRDVTGGGMPTFSELLETSKMSASWTAMQRHLLLSIGASLVSMLAVCFWIAGSDMVRKLLHVPLCVVLLLCTAGIGVSSHFGGELVHQHNVGREGVDLPTATSQPTPLERAVSVAPPLQVHLYLAGLSVAFTMVALACAVRGTTEPMILLRPISVDPEIKRISGAFSSPDLKTPAPPAPAGRAWLLLIPLLLITSATGIAYLATSTESYKPQDLWRTIVSRDESVEVVSRRLVHTITGTAMLILPIFLAIAARIWRRSALTIAILGGLLVALLVWQIWVGLLLLLDTPGGPLLMFN